MIEYTTYMRQIRDEVNEYIEKSLLLGSDICPPLLRETMHYSVVGSGKRLRAVLATMVCRMFRGEDQNVFPVVTAIEFIHCYSLIHDDLPAMDNDDYRRGKLSTHKKYGEAMGILTGDALLTHAFWLIAGQTRDKSIVAPLVETVAELAGISGMVSGQVKDMQSENMEPTPELVEYIHKYKTAALIVASCKCGAIAAKVSDQDLQKIICYGQKIGIAFQIADDILDICGDKEKIGKTVGKDEEQGKMTYPRVWGLEKSREDARKLIEEACHSIADIPKSEYLVALAEFIIDREK